MSEFKEDKQIFESVMIPKSRETGLQNQLQIVDAIVEPVVQKKHTEKEIWHFIDHGFFLEYQLDKLQTRMVDQGYTKPEMVEDPDPEVEDDDQDQD